MGSGSGHEGELMAEMMTEKDRADWERWWSRHHSKQHELGKHEGAPELFCPRCPAMRAAVA